MRLAWTGAAAVVTVSAAPGLQFRNWQWIALALAVAVVLPALHDRYHAHLPAPDRAATCERDRSPAGPRRGGGARPGDQGSPHTGVAAAGTAAGALAALAWSVTVLLDGAGAAGFVQAVGAPVLALDTAAVLGYLLLLPRDGRPRGDRESGDPAIPERLGALVLATAVAALGFRLGAGDGSGGAAAAAAVLIAGSPCALLLLPVTAPGPRRLLLRTEHGEGVLRAAAALHAAPPPADGPRPADPVGAALLATARRRHPVLPGVSDPDGEPATGLRGVVSELAGDVVLAHAVLAGPPDWLEAHGVTPTPDAVHAAHGRGTGAPGPTGRGAGRVRTVWCVAWDGRARGWLELAEAPPPGAWRRRVAIAVTVVAAGLGTGAAAVGTLSPATAGAVPVGAALLVAALRMLPAPDRARRSHPIGATAG